MPFKPVKNWGQWHEGNAFDVRIATDGRDHYPNKFWAQVEVKDKATGQVIRLRGRGNFVGNFSPIIVNTRWLVSGPEFKSYQIKRPGWTVISVEGILRLQKPVAIIVPPETVHLPPMTASQSDMGR